MELVGGALKAMLDFWNWIAPNFWPAIPVSILTIMYANYKSKRDRDEVAGRMQRREYTEWRQRFLSGELTGAPPSDVEIDRYLRWFLVRKEGKPGKFLLSNRADSPALTIRVRSETWPGRKTKRRRKIRSGKTVRLNVGRIPDRKVQGVRLDIHWDDEVMAQHVTFVIPLSEFDLPHPDIPMKPAVATPPEEPDGTATVAKPENSASETILTPAAHSSPVTVSEPPLRPQTSAVETPAAPPARDVNASGSRGIRGIKPSTNIADRTVPNRTPSLPANFDFVQRDGSLGLRNLGPGDASSVYLQPVDDAHAVVGGGFWPSIPADAIAPFALTNNRDVGMFKVRFELTWDDGYMLGRDKQLNIPGMGD